MSNELIPLKEELNTIEQLAKYAMDSKFFDKLGGMGGMVSIILYAKELGISPMTALFGGMSNVMGRIVVSPQQMNAMILRAGHSIDIVEHTDKKCVLEGLRKGSKRPVQVSFSIDDAKRAGIYKEGGGWTKYPQDMLFARAMSRLGRRVFADVIGTMYVEGEIEEGVVLDESKTVPIVPISPEETKAEEHKEVLEEISLEEGLLKVASSNGILNDEFLKTYMEDTITKYKISVSELTKMWIENKDKFIQNYERRKEKLQASTTNPETQVS